MTHLGDELPSKGTKEDVGSCEPQAVQKGQAGLLGIKEAQAVDTHAGFYMRGHRAGTDPQGPALLMAHPAALQHIPMPVLYGVFLHMGVTALNSIQVRREDCTGGGAGGEEGFCSATAQHNLEFSSLWCTAWHRAVSHQAQDKEQRGPF